MNFALLQNSLWVAVMAALFATFLGVVIGVFAATINPRYGFGVGCGAILSLTLPPFMVVNTWMNYFGLSGTWRKWINFDLYTNSGAIILLALLFWPVAFMLTLAAVGRLDKTYLEQDSAVRGVALWKYLLWPVIRPAVIQGLCLGFVLALNNFTIPTLLQTKVYSEEVWLSFSSDFNYMEALKLSWPLILGPLLLLWWIHSQPVRFEIRARDFNYRIFRERIGLPFCIAAGVLTGFILLLTLGLPLYQILSSPRTWSQFWPAMEAGKAAAWTSIWFAGGSALCVMFLMTLMRNSRWPFLTWILYLTPGVLLGIALIWLLNRPGLVAVYQSTAVVIGAFTIRYAALGWSTARSAALQTDQKLIEAVKVFGGGKWQQFRQAEWPQSKHLFLAGFYLVFLFCLWEVETLILIVPAGRETLALRVFNMLHYGHAAQVDALCLWLMLIALIPLFIWTLSRFLRKKLALTAQVALLFLAGCSGSNDSGTGIKSSIFSSVQVIGTRGTGAGQFNKPRSLALDLNDNLYVVDMTGRIQKFSPDGKYLLLWQMPETVKGKPKGMVRDIDGNIIVVEPHYSRLNHFDTSGHLVAQWGDHGTNVGQLMFPRSAGVNSRGEIYVTEYGLTERIQCFTQKGTHYLFGFGKQGGGPGEVDRAEGLGIGPGDTVFVADSCNHRVQVFSADGKFLTQFGKAGDGLGEMSYPYDVRVDSEGYRYVCEFGNHRVQIFNSQNQPIEILGGAGSEASQMSNPWSIDFDSEGNLYIADSGNHRVLKYIRRKPLKSSRKSTFKEPLPSAKVASIK